MDTFHDWGCHLIWASDESFRIGDDDEFLSVFQRQVGDSFEKTKGNNNT